MSDPIKLLEKKLAREIKAREQAEQLLEEKTEELFDTLLSISQSQALLQTALSSIQEGFLLTDRKGNILLTNHQLKAMYEQWAPSMHKDMNINDFFAPFTDHPAYQNMLKEGLKASSFEIKFSENQVIAVNVSNNDDEFIASTHSDITKEKKLLAEQHRTILKLLQAQKMESIGRMASTVAHDFNNVIAAIKGYSYFLQSDLSEDHQAMESVNKIVSAASRAEDMVRHILNYSNHGKPELMPIQVHDFIIESIELIDAIIPEQVKINLHDSNPGLFIHGDSSQMTQVMVNILKNAINAIGRAEGRINITCDQVNQYDLNQPNYKIQQFMPKDANTVTAGLLVFTEPVIKIAISDNGPGMGQNIMEQLFDMFFTTSQSNQGTGLGMYGVATIITDHLGGIKVYSKPNFGTHIELIMPQTSITQVDNKKGSEDDLVLASKMGGKVLIIDDNQEVGLLINQILAREHITSQFMHSAKEALQQILMYRNKWSLIVCDHKMPEILGLDILKLIRNNGIKTPFILTSGYLDEIKDDESIKLASQLLHKPIDKDLLVEYVRQYIT